MGLQVSVVVFYFMSVVFYNSCNHRYLMFPVMAIDIERCKNRLLKFCYVPATSAAHNRLVFFLFFAAAIYSTDEANKAGSTCR